MSALLTIDQLTHTRQGRPVLHAISCSVQAGEIVVVMGPSGSGKSTLLRCLNRLEPVSPGTIFLHGQDITTLPVLALRHRIGMIFQKSVPFPGTVAENIAWGPRLRGEELSREQIAALMTRAALDPALIDRPAAELSGGQEQRLAIARALANRPEILLLDEPTSALDPQATRAVEETMRNLRDSLGLTLIWVSHAVEQARRVADRLILLEEGRITREGPAADLLDPRQGDSHVLAFAAGRQATATE
ncbi:MAG: phosphate ABC transporter ATP-binding protein [Anaerolineae bacterium]